MKNSLEILLARKLQSAFNQLKYPEYSVDFRENESPNKEGTFQTSAQARSVLMKSENLCRRVNSLADKINSQYVSQDSCESASSRINLKIPKISANDTPLSPLSMGELDTDRLTSRMEEIEQDLANYNLLLKIWKDWKGYSIQKRTGRNQKALVDNLYRSKITRKYFRLLKIYSRKKAENKIKRTLATAKYVEKLLRKCLFAARSRFIVIKGKQRKVKEMTRKKLIKIINGWKEAVGLSSEFSRVVYEFRRKWDKKIKCKYLKCLSIISMIQNRRKQQRRIAEDYNRQRLLKLGFTHISLSVFTNKYYEDLYMTADHHFRKGLLKRYFDLYYLNFLMCKRNKVVKSTGMRMFRKNFLIKGMRRLYSNLSARKEYRKKVIDVENYYISNLYLKTLVSWQNYHNIMKAKKKHSVIGARFYRKKSTRKHFSIWKKWFPKAKRVRLTGESIEKEKKYWIMKDLLLEWTVRTKKRIESKDKYEKNCSFRRVYRVMNAWKKYLTVKLDKREYQYNKRAEILKGIACRVLQKWKNIAHKKFQTKKNAEKYHKSKIGKLFHKWRIAFIRKITIVMSNSLGVQVPYNYINKAQVAAVQARKRRKVANLLFHWKQFVKLRKMLKLSSILARNHYISKFVSHWLNFTSNHKSKIKAELHYKHQKYTKCLTKWMRFSVRKKKSKSALSHYNKKQTILINKIFFSWALHSSHKSIQKHKALEKYDILCHNKLERCFSNWKLYKERSKKNRTALNRAQKRRLGSLGKAIFKHWKQVIKYKKVLCKIIENNKRMRGYKMIFRMLKRNVCDRSIILEKKADNYMLDKLFNAWNVFVIENRKLKRVKKDLKTKAQNFFNDMGCVRGIRRLKEFAESRKLLKKADEYYWKTNVQKGIKRWSDYYFNYLKLMKQARIYDEERVLRKKSYCIKKWLYITHLNSWKNRAEKRLFFYWDRRLQRIVKAWNRVVVEKNYHYSLIYEFRSKLLKKRAFGGLRVQKALKNAKSVKFDKAEDTFYKKSLTKIFRILYKYHLHSRAKLSKLTKALRFRYFKSCSKFLSLWESISKSTRQKKIKLKKVYTAYIRSFGTKNLTCDMSYLSSTIKTLPDKTDDYLQTFLKTLTQDLPRSPSINLVSIFCKWRSLSGCKNLENTIKSIVFSKEYLISKAIRAWIQVVKYAKCRRKTLRSAIIFHRSTLKKKAFAAWKPKKIIRRRKQLYN